MGQAKLLLHKTCGDAWGWDEVRPEVVRNREDYEYKGSLAQEVTGMAGGIGHGQAEGLAPSFSTPERAPTLSKPWVCTEQPQLLFCPFVEDKNETCLETFRCRWVWQQTLECPGVGFYFV